MQVPSGQRGTHEIVAALDDRRCVSQRRREALDGGPGMCRILSISAGSSTCPSRMKPVKSIERSGHRRTAIDVIMRFDPREHVAEFATGSAREQIGIRA